MFAGTNYDESVVGALVPCTRSYVLLVPLLWMSSNRIVVMLGNQYFEPTYQLCIDTLGWIAEDASQLNQTVCNITMVKLVADGTRTGGPIIRYPVAESSSNYVLAPCRCGRHYPRLD